MDLLGNMRNGTFVEIGGNDGLSTTNTYHLERCLGWQVTLTLALTLALTTNTYHLERCLGWQGLLIEGHPENFNKMVRARPGALNLGTAVCPHPNPSPDPDLTLTLTLTLHLTLTLTLTLT